MQSKVNVCGLNTATLPKLTHARTVELIERAQVGDTQARDELVIGNMRLVLSMCQRFTSRRGNIDDVFQVGCIGLLKSIDNFNTSLNVRFSTYAVPMILGEIRRHLRDNNSIHVSRSLRDIAYKALSAREALESVSTGEVSLEEIARHIDTPLSLVIDALDAISDPVSLYDPIYHSDEDAVTLEDSLGDDKCSESGWLEDICLKDAIASLDTRERQILALRYYQGKTQIEVSDEIGISQAQVSRLEKGAIRTINGKMN